MPDKAKRKLTPEELRSLGISVSDPTQTTTTPEPDTSTKPRASRGTLASLVGAGTRLGAGYLSTEGGAPGAAISGFGEYLAQRIESPDRVDPGAIALESGLGAIPFNKIIRGIKPTVSVGKQVLANAGRMAGMNEIGNVLRRYNREGHILPQSPSEWMWDIGTSGAGALLGGVAGRRNPILDEAKAAIPSATDKVEKLVDEMARPVANPTVPERLTKPGGSASGLGGLRIKPDTPPVKAITRSIGEVGGPEITGNAARIEEAAPMSGGVAVERGIAARKRSSLHPEKIDPDGIVRQPDAVEHVLDEQIEKAANIAKVQRKEHINVQKTENKLVRAEQAADAQNSKLVAGGTDLRAIEAKAAAEAEKTRLQNAGQEARNLNTRDKFVTKAEADAAKAAKVAAAQRQIDSLLESGSAEVGPRIVSESTEKVPTASGSQTLRTVVREKLKQPDDGSFNGIELPPRPAAPVTNPTGKVEIPVTDPDIVSKTLYPTQNAALGGLAGSGKVGTIQRMGHGKWRVIYEAGADIAPTATNAVEKTAVETAQKAAGDVPVPVKTEAPPVLPEPAVAPVKALPEAATKPVPGTSETPVPVEPAVMPAIKPAIPVAPAIRVPEALKIEPRAIQAVSKTQAAVDDLLAKIEAAKTATTTAARSEPATSAILDPNNKTLADVTKAMQKEGSAVPTSPLVEPLNPLKAESPPINPPVSPLANPPINQNVNDLALAEKAAADKYFELKDAHKAGTASYEDVRAAGRAFGEAKAALAVASKAEGKNASFTPPPTPVPKPAVIRAAEKAAGPTSDELIKMHPEEQEKALTDIVSKFKALRGKAGSETGAGGTELLARLGMSSAGAIAGAAAYPEDPITGALIGFGTGFYAPSAFKTLMKHLDARDLSPAVDAASRKKIGEWVWDQAHTVLQMAPDYYRASALSNPVSLMLNGFFGPYGSAVMGSIEAHLAGDPRGIKALRMLTLPKFKSAYSASWSEAAERLSDATERTGGDIGKVGPMAFRKATAFPAQVLTAGDVAARKILMQAGFSELEARSMNLTSEPISGFFKGEGNFLKTKGPHGHQSWLGRMLLPFYRTNANQLEQGLIRLPGVGLAFRKYWKMTPISARLHIIQGAMSLGTGGTSYALGAVTPPEYQKYTLKLLSNFGGVYGTTAALGFVAGAASQNGGTAGKQLAAVTKRFLGKDMPLPSTDLLISLGKSLQAVTDDNPKTVPQLPYGAVPPFLSSKEVISIPTILRGQNPLDFKATTTKNELSLLAAVPGMDPEIKKPDKVLTPAQRAMKKQRDLYAKYKKELRDRTK